MMLKDFAKRFLTNGNETESLRTVEEPGKYPWTGSMIPEAIGRGRGADYELSSYSTVELQWVTRSKKADGSPVSVLTPEEKTTVFAYPGAFKVAGKTYQNLDQLSAAMDQTRCFRKDIYGQEVFAEWERFPCFDSFDLLYEKRCYRWFFLRENGKLYRVYHEDERSKIYVTENVRYLEAKCWESMKKQGYWDTEE